MKASRLAVTDPDLANALPALERLWDSLSATPARVPLTDPQREELDRRLDVLEDDVQQGQALGVPWDEVMRQIRNRG